MAKIWAIIKTELSPSTYTDVETAICLDRKIRFKIDYVTVKYDAREQKIEYTLMTEYKSYNYAMT